MVLVLVQPSPEMVDGEFSAEDRMPVEEPVHVTGTEIVWEGQQAFAHVLFAISEVDGSYRIGREEARFDGTRIIVDVTVWVPAPTPWAIDCSDRTLELDAYEAERIGERFGRIRARPWPERPVSEANKSGNDTAAARGSPAYSRSLYVYLGDIGETLVTGETYTVDLNGQQTLTFSVP